MAGNKKKTCNKLVVIHFEAKFAIDKFSASQTLVARATDRVCVCVWQQGVWGNGVQPDKTLLQTESVNVNHSTLA